MSDSLRDQLVKAGLVSKQSANAANAKARKKRKKPQQKSQADIEAQKVAEEKRERDKALNAELQAKQEKAAIKGQIKTLIETHALKDYNGETTHNYIMGNKIRQLFVNEQVHAQLADDKLAVTRLNGKTYLVPTDIAHKILALNDDWAVTRPGAVENKSADDGEDPYAGYEVPDDLNW